MSVQKVKYVQVKRVLRIPTMIPELDWIYGYTGSNYGLPAGKMSLWAGEKGVGKSRLAIEVCKTVARHTYKYKDRKPFQLKVLYFQKEVDMGTLAGWVKQDGGTMPDNFYVSDSATVDEQIADIRQVGPKVVVIDSINMLKEFRTHSDGAIEAAVDKYRSVCESVDCHIIFLGQLNKNGSSKGRIACLLDAEFLLKRMCSDGFSMSCPEKNRYGNTGISTWWTHTPQKVYAESSFRFEDKEYCKITGSKYRDIMEEGRIFQEQMREEQIMEELLEEEALKEMIWQNKTVSQKFWTFMFTGGKG
jgi:predicted ATP-dependent serine protease